MRRNWTEEKYNWLALHLIPGVGNIAIKNLLGSLGDPEKIFQASLADLTNVTGIRQETAQRIINREFSNDPVKELRRIEKFGARIITFADPQYPALLKEIYDPPVLLYAMGQDIPPDAVFIAVVGSRHPTTYGVKAAEKIGEGLARRGLSVVSGMARGIDAAAHRGSLKGRGYTIAVWGTGIDTVYPESNRKLFEHIIQSGTVITECPMGTPPEPKNFPIRNRIISGLSRGIVVVEATKKSGSLITASLALDHGREVFAVPGSINSFKSIGCHFLIKEGAKLVENADDVMEELGLNYKYALKKDTFNELPIPPMEASEKRIYELIGEYPVHIDQIAREGNLEPSQVSILLMKMELKGVVRQLPGKMFVR
ncbi:DNA-processing protein DprA [Thermodesulfobacteriota bacterium]